MEMNNKRRQLNAWNAFGKALRSAVLASALAMTAGGAAAGYTATMLATLGGSDTAAIGINKLGQVVGYGLPAGNAAMYATQWSAGTVTALGALGGDSVAYAMNDTGVVAGYSSTTGGGAIHATLWNGGIATDLGTLNASYTESMAIAINSSSQVVGGSRASGGSFRVS